MRLRPGGHDCARQSGWIDAGRTPHHGARFSGRSLATGRTRLSRRTVIARSSTRAWSDTGPWPAARPWSSTGAWGGGADRTLYVGNLPYDCTQRQLEELFTQSGLGPIQRINLPLGPDGRLRGYGFVTMGTGDAAQAAIGALRSIDLRGRRLLVNIAHPRGERPERATPQSESPPRAQRDVAPPEARGYSSAVSFAAPPDGTLGPNGDKASAEGRRRVAERPDRGDKKKKKKGRGERLVANTRRERERHIDWEDWEDDK
ncbi:RNA recognition motif domain-containing protein [Myxococcota bacterium]